MRSCRWFGWLAPLPLCALLGAACASAGPALPEILPEINATYGWTEAHLAPGDELELKFAEKAEYDHQAVVRETGAVALLGVGEIPVAGLTMADLEREVVERYSTLFAVPPRVSVQLRGRAQRHVIVIGEVHAPGRVVFDGRMTFQEALGLAGGARKDTALLKQTLLVRWVAGESRQRTWTFDARNRHWDTAEPLYLQPDDVLFIPNTPIDDVDIWVEQYIRRLIPFPIATPVGFTP